MKTAVLYHNDADGFGAAWACWKALGSEALYLPVQYGQAVPGLPESVEKLLIVDFSYDRETCERLSQRFKQLVILDHHKTAQAELDGLAYARFDMNKSGCVLAWEFLFPGKVIPEILLYVEDRDLWKFELSLSEEINLFIGALPRVFDAWDGFNLESAVTGGTAIKAFRDAQIGRAVENVRMEYFCGYTIPVLNASDNVSELGNELCKRFPESPFTVSYCDRGEGKRTYSLRSIGDFDVSLIAKQYGGGGHRNAAGFTAGIPW